MFCLSTLFFSVGEKVENIPGLSFRLYRAVKKINSLLLYKGYQKMRGQSIPPGLSRAGLPPISRTRACVHIYMPARSFQTPAARHMAGRKPPNLLFRQSSPRRLSPVCQEDSFSLQQKKKAAPKRKPSLFFCCTRFVFFISAPKRGK